MNAIEFYLGKTRLFRVEAPAPAFKDVDDAKKGLGIMSFKEYGPGSFPCLECSGRGRIVHPDEQLDPIEGYKLAKRINCPSCGGTGYGTKKKFMACYNSLTKRYREELDKSKRMTELTKRVFSTMTEKEAVELLGFIRDEGFRAEHTRKIRIKPAPRQKQPKDSKYVPCKEHPDYDGSYMPLKRGCGQCYLIWYIRGQQMGKDQ